MSFRIPRKEPPKQSSCKQRCSLYRALHLSLKFPVNGLPRFPNGPLQKETPVSRTFFYTFPSKSLVNEPPPPPCFPTESLWREKLHLQRQWFIYSRVSVRVPNKKPSHEKRGKYLITVHGVPRGRKATYNGVRPGSPRGSFTTLQSLPQCHVSFSTILSTLAWVDQSPVSQRVS